MFLKARFLANCFISLQVFIFILPFVGFEFGHFSCLLAWPILFVCLHFCGFLDDESEGERRKQ